MDWKSAFHLRRRRRRQSTTVADDDDENDITEIKLPKKLQEYFSHPLDSSVKTFQETKDEHDLAMLHSLLAELFAGVAAVKSAYAELQLAQSPYSIDSIHAADRSLVSELKYLSSLKRSYLKDPLSLSPSNSYQQSQLRELKELIKTFKINISRLESEQQSKDSQVESLRSDLDEIERENRSLEYQLLIKTNSHHHISGLNPTHFLPELRLTVKRVRSFARAMMKSMESSKLDLNSAAGAMYPNIVPDTKNLLFFFQSFVSHKMFSGFHHPDFNLGFLESRSNRSREEFFREFNDSKLLSSSQFLDRWGDFVRAKFSAMVHPKIDPGSDLFPRFVEMARRVWILHCLFFYFSGSEFSGSIFRVRSGCRFSEVYMESVAVADLDPVNRYSTPTVGFTVVPGFRFGSTVIQCKVYLSHHNTIIPDDDE
ncbi:uncharacterized protein M6B38_390570 [Iris pallida]|uniref:DUF641 domain-containing protein n=1 Tax=Iris pallida TaxID=29817 RepID=A0AAX6FZ78_IRIPA|nr:uncharacterized protein M6B38_390570 [Iris pallida]